MYLVLHDPENELVFCDETFKPFLSPVLEKAIEDAELDITGDDQNLLVGRYDRNASGYVQAFERDEDFFCPECGAESYGYGYCFCPNCHVSALNESLKQQGSKMWFEWRERI